MEQSQSRSASYQSKKSLWQRLLLTLYWQTARFPFLHRGLVKLWRAYSWRLSLTIWWLRSGVRSIWGIYQPWLDDGRLHWISPQQIQFSALREFDLNDFRGHVIPGDWDRLEKRFEDLDVFRAFQQVFQEGKAWQETQFYQNMLTRIQQHHAPRGYRTQAELDQRCQDLAALHETIARNGYYSQLELLTGAQSHNPYLRNDEITISIGRHGDLLFSNGAHRLSLAKLLDLPRVPVRIAVHHPEWLDFRRQLELYARRHGGKLPQPVEHPDLAHIPAHTPDEEGLRLLYAQLPVTKGRILVLNAGLGYLCRRLEEEGFTVFAHDPDPQMREFLCKLCRAENRNFHPMGASLPAAMQNGPAHFDAVVALHGIDTYLQTAEDRAQLEAFLRTVEADRFLIAGPAPEASVAAEQITPQWVDFVAQNRGAIQCDSQGAVSAGNVLYKFVP